MAGDARLRSEPPRADRADLEALFRLAEEVSVAISQIEQRMQGQNRRAVIVFGGLFIVAMGVTMWARSQIGWLAELPVWLVAGVALIGAATFASPWTDTRQRGKRALEAEQRVLGDLVVTLTEAVNLADLEPLERVLYRARLRRLHLGGPAPIVRAGTSTSVAPPPSAERASG